MKSYFWYSTILLITFSCSKDSVDPICTPAVKADLFNASMKVTQIDDHHFNITTEVTNLSKGKCAESTVETFGTLKVYFGASAAVSQADQLVYEKTFALSPFAPLEKRALVEFINLHDLGYYLFVWTVDHQNMVDENDEDNNTIVRTHWKQN